MSMSEKVESHHAVLNDLKRQIRGSCFSLAIPSSTTRDRCGTR